MPRGNATWIQSNAVSPREGYFTLGFAAETLLPFAAEKEMRRCAQEIIDVLRRYGIDVELREGDQDAAGR
jgi:hypothetical protein